MPIKIPSDLPAFDVLKKEGVMVMDDFHATRQDIRPLRLGLLNLMPKKNPNRKSVCSRHWGNSTTN
jgi:homoserine O-succinyltransferase